MLDDLIECTETTSLQESKSDFLKGIGSRISTVHEYSRNLTLHPTTVPEVEVELLNPMDLNSFLRRITLCTKKEI